LPYILLPDGSIRFVWDQIAGLLVSVQSTSFAPEVSIAREGGVP
jgi:hypothetical protein